MWERGDKERDREREISSLPFPSKDAALQQAPAPLDDIVVTSPRIASSMQLPTLRPTASNAAGERWGEGTRACIPVNTNGCSSACKLSPSTNIQPGSPPQSPPLTHPPTTRQARQAAPHVPFSASTPLCPRLARQAPLSPTLALLLTRPTAAAALTSRVGPAAACPRALRQLEDGAGPSRHRIRSSSRGAPPHLSKRIQRCSSSGVHQGSVECGKPSEAGTLGGASEGRGKGSQILKHINLSPDARQGGGRGACGWVGRWGEGEWMEWDGIGPGHLLMCAGCHAERVERE
jgi:hypothetical protein